MRGGTKVRRKDGSGEECGFSDKCFKVSWGEKNLMLVSGSSGLETLCAILSFVNSQIQELGLGLPSFSRSLFSLSPFHLLSFFLFLLFYLLRL